MKIKVVLITDELKDPDFISPAKTYACAGQEVVTIQMQADKINNESVVSGKTVFAICHSPQLLISVNTVCSS